MLVSVTSRQVCSPDRAGEQCITRDYHPTTDKRHSTRAVTGDVSHVEGARSYNQRVAMGQIVVGGWWYLSSDAKPGTLLFDTVV
jgi:hypothetical protein